MDVIVDVTGAANLPQPKTTRFGSSNTHINEGGLGIKSYSQQLLGHSVASEAEGNECHPLKGTVILFVTPSGSSPMAHGVDQTM